LTEVPGNPRSQRLEKLTVLLLSILNKIAAICSILSWNDIMKDNLKSSFNRGYFKIRGSICI